MREATMPFGSTTMGFVRSLEQKILEFIVNYIIGKVLDITVKVVEPTFRALIKKLNVRFPLGRTCPRNEEGLRRVTRRSAQSIPGFLVCKLFYSPA